MSANPSKHLSRLAPQDLQKLFDALKAQDYAIVGPTIDSGVIVYRELHTPEQLPRGWQEEQRGGYYKLHPCDASQHSAENMTTNAPSPVSADPSSISPLNTGPYFAHRLGPDSARAWFLPHKQQLWTAKRTDKAASHYEIFYPPEAAKRQSQKLAFIGLRACDIKAISVQDRVFLEGEYIQPHYAAGRENTLIIAVNCTTHASTCFCTSVGAGPEVSHDFDIALTEVCTTKEHFFTAQSGSDAGAALLETLSAPTATPDAQQKATAAITANAQAMPKRNLENVPANMKLQPEHPIWSKLADECLACGNCTLVCPTCFCTTVEDSTDLTGEIAERWQTWDSCFNEGHSYIHGGKVHDSIASRYRQWATHKLSSWHDQFGESGCVGCGRCIAWCPVGIDIRETAETFADTDPQIEADTTPNLVPNQANR